MVRDSEAKDSGLRREVGFFGVLGQSVAGVAPTTTPTINVALVFAVAGSGSWFAYLIATCGMLLVALNLRHFARSFSGAGSLSDFAGHGLGPLAKLITAWALLIAYIAVSAATLAGSAAYLSTLFVSAGLSLPIVFWVAVEGSVAVLFAFRDIRLSTLAMLALECFSILLVILLGLAILHRQGLAVDLSQFDTGNLASGGLGNALLIAVLSFAGFEAAATLGDESRKPLRDIPRALVLTPLLAGLFFVFAAYVIVLGFNRYNIAVATSSAPLDDLAHALNLPGLGTLVALGTAVSLFTCVVATMVAASRIAYALSHQGDLPEIIGRLDRRSRPTIGVGISALMVMGLTLALAIFAKPLDIYDWLGTFGTYGCVIAYAMVCAAAPVYLHRNGLLRASNAIIAAVALSLLGFVVTGSVYPVPEAPLNILPWLFAVLLGAGTLYSLARRRGRDAATSEAR
ncbi:MAG: APC family permease [Rhizobiales bacterium]|nr:APC family permease [Hyphomicrobiales bacterium]